MYTYVRDTYTAPELRLHEKVAKGAEELDRIRPDWFREINVEAINMYWFHSCIIGQLWGNFTRDRFTVALLIYPGYEHVFADDDDATTQVMIDHGFLAREMYQYPEITEHWKEEIARRLN